MLFNSIEYLFFFPFVVAVYFCLSHKYRWILLLASSYFFYMYWKPEYIILIIITTFIDYFVALKIQGLENKKHRRNWLLVSIVSNLGLLFLFKYFTFFNTTLSNALSFFNVTYKPKVIDLLLPVGISFYTFQTLAYVIDVYWGKLNAEKSFGKFALFISFFPQLVAGPIERATNLLPQFNNKSHFDIDRVTSGFRLICWGLFKKVVVADNFAVTVNLAYEHIGRYSGWELLTATYLFAFQIYCDFSGYSDIAIGSARVMGFELMDNFKTPYFSKSVSEFWKRWHISLSTFFRDYLYFPLGGNRKSKQRQLLNLLIVFLLSGLWHGANWTFVIWGCLHGVYVASELFLRKIYDRLAAILPMNKFKYITNSIAIFITFHLVNIGWVFFRAKNADDALLIISKIGSSVSALTMMIIQEGFFTFYDLLTETVFISANLIYLKFAVAFLFLLIIEKNINMRNLKLNIVSNYLYFTIILLIIIYRGSSIQEQFIYFQF